MAAWAVFLSLAVFLGTETDAVSLKLSTFRKYSSVHLVLLRIAIELRHFD